MNEPAAYHAEGILYLPDKVRFDYLLNRPEPESQILQRQIQNLGRTRDLLLRLLSGQVVMRHE